MFSAAMIQAAGAGDDVLPMQAPCGLHQVGVGGREAGGVETMLDEALLTAIQPRPAGDPTSTQPLTAKQLQRRVSTANIPAATQARSAVTMSGRSLPATEGRIRSGPENVLTEV